MKKKLLALTFGITVLFLTLPLFAKERIIDNAGLLSPGEKARLEGMIEELYSAYNFELLILTEKNIGREDSIDYSWNFLDKRGLYGDSWDGCLLLRSMGISETSNYGKEYAFTASGRGDKILNNTAYNKLENDVVNLIAKDEYIRGFETYIAIWDMFLALEARGRNYNFFTHYHMISLLIVWLIAILIGFLIVASWKKKMNTALPKTHADTYIVPESLVLTQQLDTFLYSTTSREAKASSSSGGGSSRSGGGRSSRSGRR